MSDPDFTDLGFASIEDYLRADAAAWTKRRNGGQEQPEKLSAHLRETVGQKRFFSAREIASLAPIEVPWVARPWAARAALTEVEGKIKAAGKTSWVLALCRQVLDGSPFLGEPTARSAVVYLTEQPSTSFVQALRRADLLERDDFSVLSRLDSLDLDWPATVELAAAECERIGSSLLVVDTLGPFAGLAGDTENSSGDAQEAVAPLQAVAQRLGLAVMIVRHSRKGGGEVGESGRGSSAFGGAVDLLISLRRRDGNAPKTQRVIYTLGRFDETPDDLVIDLTDAGYVTLGSEQDAGLAAIKEALIVALVDGAALKFDELQEAAEAELGEGRAARTSVQRAVEDLGLHKVGEGKRGDPYRYQLEPPEKLSAQPSLLDGQKEKPAGEA